MRRDFSLPGKYLEPGHAACGIAARFRTGDLAAPGSFGVLRRVLHDLANLQDRGGMIQSDAGVDGDGAGVMTTIPRALVEEDLGHEGLNASLASSVGWGIVFLPKSQRVQNQFLRRLKVVLAEEQLSYLYHRPVPTNPAALGPAAARTEPDILRIGVIVRSATEADKKMYRAKVRIEKEFPDVHFPSFSSTSVVYKVMGVAETLPRYFPELRNSRFKTRYAIGHVRMSTNTRPLHKLAHPFPMLCHNGEVNTIERLIATAESLGVPLPRGGSDTAVLDRILEAFIADFGYSPVTAFRILFNVGSRNLPGLPQPLRSELEYFRRAFGFLVQGPVAVTGSYGQTAYAFVDHMSLRPLWIGRAEKEIFLTSERGVVEFGTSEEDPRPIAGGEAVFIDLSGDPRVMTHADVAAAIHADAVRVGMDPSTVEKTLVSCSFVSHLSLENNPASRENPPREMPLSTLGFTDEDLDLILQKAQTAVEPLGSVGLTPDPLAALDHRGSSARRNVADYILETVAVVTNPSIDSVREGTYFSIETLLGPNPGLRTFSPEVRQVRLTSPVLFREDLRSLKSLLSTAHLNVARVKADFQAGESQATALRRLRDAVRDAVREKKTDILILDSETIDGFPLDPHLAASAAIRELSENETADSPTDRGTPASGSAAPRPSASGGPASPTPAGRGMDRPSLFRRVSIIVESPRVRNLHDIVLLLGLGVSAVCPTRLEQLVLDSQRPGLKDVSPQNRLSNLKKAMEEGLKKVMSTMGIYELEGYGRIFAAIGLSDELAQLLGIISYLGGATEGLTLEQWSEWEQARFTTPPPEKINKMPLHWSGKIRRVIEEVASGKSSYEEYENAMMDYRSLAENGKGPFSVRHLLTLRMPDEHIPLAPDSVDMSVGEHASPVFFAAMSFGASNLTSFTSYLYAARELDILCVNGEGGEPEHLRGEKFRKWRSQQIASGRFGIDTEILADASWISIKIGQGAKPGEGGMLRGIKVTPAVAATRHCKPGIDLISPANNHDLYSIEDLIPTLIQELRTVNPDVKVEVKVPAIPNLGNIVSGLAKEGHPDAICISGFEGGTGGARRHSMRWVGFPAEIALAEAHRSLVELGLRDRVELRVDGGIKTADELLTLIALGADRVGFGTLPMAVIGCIYCTQCSTVKCPTGITSPWMTQDEAVTHGVKVYEARELDRATNALVTFFKGLNGHVRRRLALLNVPSVRALRGRTDLLSATQINGNLRLVDMLAPVSADSEISRRNAASAWRVIRGRMFTATTENHRQIFSEEIRRRADRPASSARIVTADSRRGGNGGKKSPGIELRLIEPLSNTDRSVGTSVSGELARLRLRNPDALDAVRRVEIAPRDACIPGNGLAAFNYDRVHVRINGGAQDGTAKSLTGGRVEILPGENFMGKLVDGSIGKSAAYGAIGGCLIVDGPYADSRLGIRLSGADLIHLGEVKEPLTDELGEINSRANLKGFAFEYMFSGRGLILGDPGLDLAAGIKGGTIYCHVDPEKNLTKEAIRRRLGIGAAVADIEDSDELHIRELITLSCEAIEGHAPEKAKRLRNLLGHWRDRFVKVIQKT
ncbi:hypothetical protein HY522_00800 [bacterium]|nr:hypothetical protein [bacterium]